MSDKRFQVIYADPPWRFPISIPNMSGGVSNADMHYRTMSNKEIIAFFADQVSLLAERYAYLFMWSTAAHLSVAIQAGTAAGFKYTTIGFVWLKKTSKGNNVCFMGAYTNPSTEVCLLFTKPGSRKRIQASRKVAQLIEAERGPHSAKPVETYERIEKMCPDTDKIELFARNTRPGWTSWGDQL